MIHISIHSYFIFVLNWRCGHNMVKIQLARFGKYLFGWYILRTCFLTVKNDYISRSTLLLLLLYD